MSKPIKQEIQDLLREHIILATREAAEHDKVPVHSDTLALLSQPGLMIVNAPVSGVETLDFKALFDGHTVLDDTPVMYWQLSGDVFGDAKSPVPAGFYTVVANQKLGVVSLRDAKGKTVAKGDLAICIQNPPTVMAKTEVSGGVDSVKFGHKSIKVCGHVTVSVGPASVTISGCITVHT